MTRKIEKRGNTPRARASTPTTRKPAPASSPAPGGRKRRTQAERTAESDARLLRAAVQLIAHRGYHGASLEAIGTEAGYSRGLVSQRFGSKGGLLQALVRAIIEGWIHERLEPAMAGLRGLEAVRAGVRAHGQAVQEAPDDMRALYLLMFEPHAELASTRAELARLDRAQRELVEKLLREGQKDGSVSRRIDPRAHAVLIVGCVRGIVMQWLLDPQALDVPHVYEELDRALQLLFREPVL